MAGIGESREHVRIKSNQEMISAFIRTWDCELSRNFKEQIVRLIH
jgi:hypothetical protein